ncbi:MAG: FHA domain-containing protein FhaB/FipA [Dermatophilaceae bacterium]
MSEITLTVFRLGLLVALWLFVFAVVGVLRGDLYGTRVKRRAIVAPRRRASGRASAARAGWRSGAEDADPAGPTESRRGSRFGLRRGRGAAKAPTRLVVTAGQLAGTTLPLRPAGTLIGRSPECALVLDDDYASGRHARIYEEADGRWMVEDLRSTNGTHLGATPLTAPSEVAVGSILRIGNTVLELQR